MEDGLLVESKDTQLPMDDGGQDDIKQATSYNQDSSGASTENQEQMEQIDD